MKIAEDNQNINQSAANIVEIPGRMNTSILD
jgi:hypothetical protein